jgi:hypothetical protein
MSTPSFGLNPLDAERKRLERRRALVDILQKQALAGPQAPTMPGAQMSPYQGLASMGQALISALTNRAQEKREKEFAGKELEQAKKGAARIAETLIPQGPDLGPAVTPTQETVGGYAPIYAPEQQVAAPGGQMVGPGLSRDIIEQLSMPGQQSLSGTFAAQQERQKGINAQTDARRSLLAQTIAGGGPAAQLAISQQVSANERADALKEQMRREKVQSDVQAARDAEERSRLAAEASQKESEAASSRALAEAKLNEDRRQFEETSLRQAQQFKATQQQALQIQIAKSAEEARQRKFQADQAEKQRQFMTGQQSKGRGQSVKQQISAQKEVDISDAAISSAEKSIADIKALLQHPGIGTVGNVTGSMFVLKGTPEYDFRNELSSIIASSRVAGIQAIKGSGAVSNAEGEAAAKYLTALSPDTTLDQFKTDAKSYIDLLNGVIEKNKKRKKLLQDQSATDDWTVE